MPSLRTVFSDRALQSAVDNVMGSIPEGQNSALVAHVDLEGASLSLLVRVADHWTIQAAAIKPWTGPISAEAEIVASW